MKPLGATIAAILLGSAIHLDWHFARPAHHRLSLGLSWHWMLAIPVFAFAAYWVTRQNPGSPVKTSALLLGAATLSGAVIEPAWEYFVGHAPYDWAFGPERTWGAISYVATGIVSYALTYMLLRRRLSVAS
jgi:hypothetical protein